jgi:hypothetical protein
VIIQCLYAVHERDTSVRNSSSKGRIVSKNFHFRTYRRGHIVTASFWSYSNVVHTVSIPTGSSSVPKCSISSCSIQTYFIPFPFLQFVGPDDGRTHILSPHFYLPMFYLPMFYLPSPHVLSPHVLSPHVLSSHVLSPHVLSPHVLSPHVLSPHVLSPHVLSPHVLPPLFYPPMFYRRPSTIYTRMFHFKLHYKRHVLQCIATYFTPPRCIRTRYIPTCTYAFP